MRKVKLSNCEFEIIFVTINGQTYTLFRNIFRDVETEGKGQINTANIAPAKFVF